MLFVLGFLFTFVLGGLSGVWLALVPIDVHVSGTYFIVAHIHYVLFGGSVFTIYAGLYFWYPKMTGKMYNETLGKWHFWITFITFNATFFPMHYIGTEGMLRRISDYEPKYANWNMFITLCAFLLGISTFIFVYNAIVSWIRGEPAPANPWRSLTLEWQVSSPPPVFNFDSQPRIVGGPYNYGQPGARHAVFDKTATPDLLTEDRMSVEAAHSVGPPSGYGRFGSIDRVMVGLITFLASEVMLFGSFFTAFFYIRYSGVYPVVPAAPVRHPEGPHRDQHVHPDLVLVHDALGARLGEAEQPPGAGPRAVLHARARPDLPRHPDVRVPRTSASRRSRAPSARRSSA